MKLQSLLARLPAPFRRLASHGLIYGLVGMAGSLASVALTPVYARYLGPAAYGQLETLLALVQVVTIIAAFGAGSATLALIIQPDGEPPAIAGSALVVVVIQGALCLSLGLLAAPSLAGLFGLPATWVRLVAFCGYLTAIAQIPNAIWRARGQAWLLAGVTLAQVLATLVFNIVQVAWLGHGAEGILYSLLLVQAGAVLFGVARSYREWHAGYHGSTVREIVSIGSTHVCNSLATWIVQLSDRFLLMAAVAAVEVGHYTLSNKISFIGQLLLATPLALAWPSFLQQMGQDARVAGSFGRLFEGIIAYGGGLFLLISLFAREWIMLFGGTGYLSAMPLVPVLAGAVLLNALMPMLLAGLGLAMSFRLYPLITFVSAGVNLLLNLWWIPYWGALGSAWATLAAYATAAVLGRVISERLWPLPVDWRHVGGFAGWAGLLATVGLWVAPPVWRVLLFVLYPLGLFAWFCFQQQQTNPRPSLLAD